MKIAIIIGSTRPGRRGEAVAKWVQAQAAQRTDATFEIVDVAEANLPLLDEPAPAIMGNYTHEHTKAWSRKIAPFDSFVFVIPEYNHGLNAALKNAIDYLYAEWVNKAAGIVSYGSIGGARSAEQLRMVMAQLQLADVQAQVMLSIFTDFEGGTPKPAPNQEKALNTMLDQVVAWGTALKTLRK
jgi:NAD(P)H-dependent FMN reductase